MDLKPCPFCGKKATLSYANGRYGSFGFVKCMVCDGQSKTVKIIEPEQFSSEDKFWTQRAWEGTVIAWNNRVYEYGESPNGGKL